MRSGRFGTAGAVKTGGEVARHRRRRRQDRVGLAIDEARVTDARVAGSIRLGDELGVSHGGDD